MKINQDEILNSSEKKEKQFNYFLDTDLSKRLLDMLEKQLGKRSEIVLHDLRSSYDHTIVDIRNGEITGRKVGGTGSNLGLEVLKGNSGSGDKYNYITKTSNGKYLRSSSLYIRDETDKVIGSLCINTDITKTLEFEEVIKEINNCDLNEIEKSEIEENEIFVENVQELLEKIIIKTEDDIGKKPEKMSRDDKIRFIKKLNEKGVFLITKSGEKVQDYLGISKYTLYNYLDISKDY